MSKTATPATPLTILNVYISSESSVAAHFREFFELTVNVLENNRGWQQCGLIFQFVDTMKQAHLCITLVKNQVIRKLCEFDQLSCAFTDGSGQCFINFERWKDGSRDSLMSLEQYRSYLINHEIGHLLGLGHDRECIAPEMYAPAMMPQTLGTRGCRPNCWPLKHEIAHVKQFISQKLPPFHK